MGTSVLHIKSEIKCQVFLFDEKKGTILPNKYFNLNVRKGFQDLTFVSAEDSNISYTIQYKVDENDCDYILEIDPFYLTPVSTEVTEEELANGVIDEYGVLYSPDGKYLLCCKNANLENYTVKTGCRVIKNGAFYLEESENITIDGLPQYNFNGLAYPCKLSSITIPEGLTHIGDWAFNQCQFLSECHLPSSLIHIGEGAFYSCIKLKNIELPPNITSIIKETFCYCENLTSVVLPKRLTQIGESAFCRCSSLSQIILPSNLTCIEDSAFCRCSSIQKISLPSSVTHIGDCAFYHCDNLNDIQIPQNIHIGDEAFEYTPVNKVR